MPFLRSGFATSPRMPVTRLPISFAAASSLEMFKADQFVDVSLNNWLRHAPPEAVTSHLNLGPELIAKIPSEKELVIAG